MPTHRHSHPSLLRACAAAAVLCTGLLLLPGCGTRSGGEDRAGQARRVDLGENNRPRDSITFAEKRLLDIYNRQESLMSRYAANPENFSQDSMEMQVVNIVDSYDAYLADNPDDLTARLLLGKFLVQVGQHEQAIRHFLRADQQEPDIPVVKQQIGNYLAETGRYMAALPYFLNAIDLDPEVAVYYYQLAGLLFEYREFYIRDGFYTREELEREMMDALARAVQLDPERLPYWRTLGEAYYELQNPDWQDALNVWNNLLPRLTDPVDRQAVQLHRARVLFLMGRHDDALQIARAVDDPALALTRSTLIDEISAGRERP